MHIRAVIYTRGDDEETERQLQQCLTLAASARAVVVAVAADRPDTATGWDAANAMVRDGDAERILVSTRAVIPRVIEPGIVDSITDPHQRTRRPRRTGDGVTSG